MYFETENFCSKIQSHFPVQKFLKSLDFQTSKLRQFFQLKFEEKSEKTIQDMLIVFKFSHELNTSNSPCPISICQTMLTILLDKVK